MYYFNCVEDIFEQTHKILYTPQEFSDQVARLKANWLELIDYDLLRINIRGLPPQLEVKVWDSALLLQNKYLYSTIQTSLIEEIYSPCKTYQLQGDFDVFVDIFPHPHSSKILEEFFDFKSYEQDLERLRAQCKFEMEYQMLRQEYLLLVRILDLPAFQRHLP